MKDIVRVSYGHAGHRKKGIKHPEKTWLEATSPLCRTCKDIDYDGARFVFFSINFYISAYAGDNLSQMFRRRTNQSIESIMSIVRKFLGIEEGALDYSFKSLKTKQRELRDGFPSNLGLRLHRALSWLQRSEAEQTDFDAKFIFLWISFNAAYAEDTSWGIVEGEKHSWNDFFDRILQIDNEHQIYDVVWSKYPSSIRLFLDNKFVFQPFWNFHNNVDGNSGWEDRFLKSKRLANAALTQQDTGKVLSILFDRLYVLRNQLLHGGATWNSSVNRNQVKDGANILASLVPVFINTMMDHPDSYWDAPYYPVIA